MDQLVNGESLSAEVPPRSKRKSPYVRVRVQLGLTTAELAALVGVTRETIYYNENRSHDSVLNTLMELVLTDIPWGLSGLLGIRTRFRPKDQAQLELLTRIARRHFGRHAFATWESTMRSRYPELFPDEPNQVPPEPQGN
jgi:transcriptional regulator with XRE-family HTH domain